MSRCPLRLTTDPSARSPLYPDTPGRRRAALRRPQHGRLHRRRSGGSPPASTSPTTPRPRSCGSCKVGPTSITNRSVSWVTARAASLAPMVAARNPDVAFVISMAGSGEWTVGHQFVLKQVGAAWPGPAVKIRLALRLPSRSKKGYWIWSKSQDWTALEAAMARSPKRRSQR